ncbi:MAG: hypothetical protein JW750_00095 [Anaerolineaceae bacterium]|nr:hypothetical protein [Anaerolineaceae bacterium]
MITEKEKRWIIGYAIGLVVVTTLPYLLAYAAQGAEWAETGFLISVEDGNSYISKMMRGAAGDWLFRTPFSSDEQTTGLLAFIPYLLLGKLTAPPAQHEQLVALYHLFRAAGVGFMVWSTYLFSAAFLQSSLLRKSATVLSTVGGGLGWLYFLVPGLWGGPIPLEFYSPEAFGFLSLFSLPHLCYARGFLLLGLRVYLAAVSTDGSGKIWLLFARYGWWFWLGWMQPLTIVVGYTVIACDLLLQNARNLRRFIQTGVWVWDDVIPSFWRAFWLVLFSLPWVIYNGLSSFLDPFFSRWTEQNLILSPPPGDYLLGFGILLLLGVWSVSLLVRKKQWERYRLLIAYALAVALLVYVPYNLQRRFSEGVWAALCILALVAFDLVPTPSQRKWLMGLGGISILTTVIFLAGTVMSAVNPAAPIFRPRAEVEMFNAMREVVPNDSVVLAPYETSNAMTAWVPVFVVIGHSVETPDFHALQEAVDAFYAGEMTDEEMLMFLKTHRVDYVWVRSDDGDVSDWLAGEADLFHLGLSNSGYQIFELIAD